MIKFGMAKFVEINNLYRYLRLIGQLYISE